MRRRRFGRLGWQVSEIGYGMWGMGGWTGSDDDESRRSLDRAVELGCNFFDTAFAYGMGRSEKLLGEPLRRHAREEAVHRHESAARKLAMAWPSRHPDCRCLSPRAHPRVHGKEPGEPGRRQPRPAAASRLERCVGGRRRLAARGRRPQAPEADSGVWHQRQPLAACQCRQGARTGLVDAVQVVYNIFDQNPEDELFPVCRELDLAVIARVPFDEGSLTGTLTRDSTMAGGRLAKHLLHPGQPRRDARPGRAAPRAGARGNGSAGDGAALHPRGTGGLDGDSRACARATHVERNLAVERRPGSAGAAEGRAALASLEPHARHPLTRESFHASSRAGRLKDWQNWL